jgi:hypothetical protein
MPDEDRADDSNDPAAADSIEEENAGNSDSPPAGADDQRREPVAATVRQEYSGPSPDGAGKGVIADIIARIERLEGAMETNRP